MNTGDATVSGRHSLVSHATCKQSTPSGVAHPPLSVFVSLPCLPGCLAETGDRSAQEPFCEGGLNVIEGTDEICVERQVDV